MNALYERREANGRVHELSSSCFLVLTDTSGDAFSQNTAIASRESHRDHVLSLVNDKAGGGWLVECLLLSSLSPLACSGLTKLVKVLEQAL